MKKNVLRFVLVAAILLMTMGLPLAPGEAAAQPQPTLVLSPDSGPCDATVEVAGSLPADQFEFLWLYLVQPGTTDTSIGTLNDGLVPVAGEFKATAPLWQHGCEAAELDRQSEQPTGHLSIALSVKPDAVQPPVQPGEHIPDIIAVAEYAYTTTAPQPRPKMAVTPAAGPCDGPVEVAGEVFPPGEDLSLHLRLPGSEDNVGALGSAVADIGGRFVLRVTLGELGCYAAGLRGPTKPQLEIVADTIPPPAQIGASLATALYTFTTTTPMTAPTPRSLPASGSGPDRRSPPVPWFPLVGGLATLGVALIAVSLHGRRAQH